MKIFLDTANVAEIETLYKTGLIDGVTTNPSLILQGGKKPEEVYQQLYDMGIPDISMEVVGNAEEMIDEGRRLAIKFPERGTIKVPCTPDGLEACRVLSKELVKVNVTLIFSAAQAILATKAGATYVSPFIGRCDDNSVAGLEVVRSIAEVYSRQFAQTKILAASIRDVYKVTRAFYNGAHIVTMPPSIFKKMYNHVLTDQGMDKFEKDYALANTIGMVS